MSENTKIEWCDHTFNPWVGCTKISPACDHCYAEGWAKRSGQVVWGGERKRTSIANWKLPLKWNRAAEANGIRPKVFCASLADVFDNEVDPVWFTDLFELIEATPNLDWLLLTKRIGNVAKMVADGRWFPTHWPNVWIGATICNQAEADRDIPKLLAVPAAKRFLSMEPLLGPVDLSLCNCDKGSKPGPGGAGGVTCPCCNGAGGCMVDWVIVGGESGHNARPMHPDWAYSLRDQCQQAGVPFLFKQWGDWHPAMCDTSQDRLAICKHTGGSFHISAGEFPRMFDMFDRCQMHRVGKKAAGRMLAGREWNGVPA